MKVGEVLPGKGVIGDRIYYGIMPSGPDKGVPALFIDIKDEGVFHSQDQLFEKVKKTSHIKAVYITGDISPQYVAVYELIKIFTYQGCRVHIETNVFPEASSFVGLKSATFDLVLATPSTGNTAKNDISIFSKLRPLDSVVFYIETIADLAYVNTIAKARQTQGKIKIIANKDEDGKLSEAFMWDTELYRAYPRDPFKFKFSVKE